MKGLELIEKVGKTLKKADIGSVLVAVSGGADSVALLRICHALALQTSLRVEAVNCNFHLRGAESDRDSRFVADLCRQLSIPLHSLDYDTEQYQRQHPGISTEMACRELRYADFHRLREQQGLDRIAVAHNADDDIETMLLNMLRGSGSRGLKGMDIDNGRIIRPLLSTTRAEIEQYLAEIGQDFITDSSNLTSDYRRNFLRRDVIPLLEERWPGARKSLGKTVAIMKEEAAIADDYYKEQLRRLTREDGSLDVYAENLKVATILRFIEQWGGNSEMAEEILEATRRPFAQRSWQLSDHAEAILERDRLIIAKDDADETVSFLWEELELNEDTMKMIKSNRDHNIIYLPNGPEAYEIRKPMPGDRIAPLGMKGTRLVSDVISDAKLDQRRKRKVRVLIRKSDGEIIWVPGLKRSRHDLLDQRDNKCYRCKILTREP